MKRIFITIISVIICLTANAQIKYHDWANFQRYSALKDENNALPEKYAADGVHPNLECYKIMEEIILRAL